MKQLCVTIHVTPAAAVRAGKTQVGDRTLTLSDEDVAALSPEQRDALARHVANEHGWRCELAYDAPPVADASLESLRVLLDARIARQAREAEAEARSLAEDEQKAVEVIKTWRTKPIEEFVDSWGCAKEARRYGYPASAPWSDRSLVDLLGREDDLAALLEARKVERAEREREEARLREIERQAVADKAARRVFVIRHLSDDGPEVTEEWFDQLESDVPAIRKALRKALAGCELEPISTEKGWRVGFPDSNVESLSLYRQMLSLADSIQNALSKEPVPINVEVESVSYFRPAEDSDDPEEVDDDNDVFVGKLMRATFVVAGVETKLYFRV